MIPSALLLLAGLTAFAAGLWLVARPWQARHWRRDAEIAHRTRLSLYEAHFGEDPSPRDRRAVTSSNDAGAAPFPSW